MTIEEKKLSFSDDAKSALLGLFALCGTILVLSFNAGMRYAENKHAITAHNVEHKSSHKNDKTILAPK